MTAVADSLGIEPQNWRGRLTAVTELMRELSRQSDPDEMHRVYVRRMGQLYPTARQITLTRRGLDRPFGRVSRYNLWADVNGSYRHPSRSVTLSGGVLTDMLHAGDVRVFDDFWVSPDDPAADFLDGQRSVLALPIFDGGTAADMVVLTRPEPHAFPRDQIPELVWMCNLFNRALRTQVASERIQTARDEADFELAAIGDMQHSLLPAAVPRPAALELAVHYRTAGRAGGDYYDFFPLPGGRFGLLVADVSGHGTQAAVLLAITHSLAHAFPEPPANPGRLLAYLNTHLGRRYTRPTGSFVTAFYGVFDPAAHTLTSASAGHPSPRLGLAGGAAWEAVPGPHRLPLGISPGGAIYPEQVTAFGPGDRLAVFTDGILDAVDRAGDPFGTDRLDAALAWAPVEAEAVVRDVVSAVDVFAGGEPPPDDRTLVVVRHTG